MGQNCYDGCTITPGRAHKCCGNYGRSGNTFCLVVWQGILWLGMSFTRCYRVFRLGNAKIEYFRISKNTKKKYPFQHPLSLVVS